MTRGNAPAAAMREAAAKACRHTRELVGAATGSSIAMALAEAEDRIRALPVPEPTVSTPPAADAGAPCTLADRVGTSATYVDQFNTRNNAAEEEREACIRILEDLRPRNDREDWTDYAYGRDDALCRAISEINARYPDVKPFVPACTCHPDDRPAGDCPRKRAASDCQQARHPSHHRSE